MVDWTVDLNLFPKPNSFHAHMSFHSQGPLWLITRSDYSPFFSSFAFHATVTNDENRLYAFNESNFVGKRITKKRREKNEGKKFQKVQRLAFTQTKLGKEEMVGQELYFLIMMRRSGKEKGRRWNRKSKTKFFFLHLFYLVSNKKK